MELTQTGRHRRSGLELQNIPVPSTGAFSRTMKRIEKDHKIGLEELRTYLAADYSAIEMRLLAQEVMD